MSGFIGRKLAEAFAVLLFVTLAAQGLSDLIPGSPATLILGSNAQPEAIARLNQEYGFNDPFFSRYWTWLTRALHGDLGNSVQSNIAVSHMLAERLPVTLEIAVATLLISLLIAIPVSMFCAANEHGWVDRCVTVLSSFMFGVPTFVGAVVLFELLANQYHVFPTYGWVPLTESLQQNISHALLPVIISSMGTTALFTRVLRGDLVSVLREDYVLAARARGLPNHYILRRHVLRPASRSLFTLTGLIFGFLMGGSIIVENYFSLPGIGQAVAEAVSGKDLPVVQGVVVLVALVFLVLNTIVDIGQTLIDPQLTVQT